MTNTESKAMIELHEKIDVPRPVHEAFDYVLDFRSVIEWDFKSNPDAAPEERLLYMLFYQMSRMCREKGAVKHDDRLDCLAQGVKYYTDALAISARETMKLQRREVWNDMLEAWMDDPQAAANHMVFGMNLDQRKQARQEAGKKSVPTWV